MTCSARVYLLPALVCALPSGHEGEHSTDIFVDGEEQGIEEEMEARITWQRQPE